MNGIAESNAVIGEQFGLDAEASGCEVEGRGGDDHVGGAGVRVGVVGGNEFGEHVVGLSPDLHDTTVRVDGRVDGELGHRDPLG